MSRLGPLRGLTPSCRVRTTTLYERLAAMTAEGTIAKSADGYRLVSRCPPVGAS